MATKDENMGSCYECMGPLHSKPRYEIPSVIGEKAFELHREFKANMPRKDYEAWITEAAPLLEWLAQRRK